MLVCCLLFCVDDAGLLSGFPFPFSLCRAARLRFVCGFTTQLLENLVVAMESEAQVIDISRVSGFMQKVRSTASIVMAGVLNVLLQVRNGVI